MNEAVAAYCLLPTAYCPQPFIRGLLNQGLYLPNPLISTYAGA
jgi:hypothetical protein